MKGPTVLLYILNLSGGGAERQMISLTGPLAAHGRVIFYLKNRYSDYNFQVPAGVKVVYYEYSSTFNSSPLSLIKQLFHLRKTVIEEQVDVVYARLFNSMFRVYLAKLLFRLKCRFIACEASNPILLVKHQSLKGNWFGIQPIFYKAAMHSADAVICLNKSCRKDIAKFANKPLEDIHFIPIGLNTEHIDTALAFGTNAPREIEKGKINIISIGRLHEIKDHQTLIKAVNIIVHKKGLSNINVVILGQGPLYQDLKRLISQFSLVDFVQLCGFKSNPFAYLKLADLFVFTSLFEGFGNALLEALYCKVPVVTTDCEGGPRELFDVLGDFGELVPIGNEVELADRIYYAIQNKQVMESRANRIYNEIIKKYDKRLVAEMTWDLFQQVVKGDSKRVT